MVSNLDINNFIVTVRNNHCKVPVSFLYRSCIVPQMLVKIQERYRNDTAEFRIAPTHTHWHQIILCYKNFHQFSSYSPPTILDIRRCYMSRTEANEFNRIILLSWVIKIYYSRLQNKRGASWWAVGVENFSKINKEGCKWTLGDGSWNNKYSKTACIFIFQISYPKN